MGAGQRRGGIEKAASGRAWSLTPLPWVESSRDAGRGIDAGWGRGGGRGARECTSGLSRSRPVLRISHPILIPGLFDAPPDRILYTYWIDGPPPWEFMGPGPHQSSLCFGQVNDRRSPVHHGVLPGMIQSSFVVSPSENLPDQNHGGSQ